MDCSYIYTTILHQLIMNIVQKVWTPVCNCRLLPAMMHKVKRACTTRSPYKIQSTMAHSNGSIYTCVNIHLLSTWVSYSNHYKDTMFNNIDSENMVTNTIGKEITFQLDLIHWVTVLSTGGMGVRLELIHVNLSRSTLARVGSRDTEHVEPCSPGYLKA